MPTAEADERALIEVAHAAFGAWDSRPARVQLVSRSENIVFRVEDAAGAAHVLRIHRPGYHTLAELESEQHWTRALDHSGVGAPVPRPTRDGRGYVSVVMPGSGDERHVGLAAWMEGETLRSLIEGTEMDEVGALGSRFVSLGRLAAQIHEQGSTWRPPEGFERHALDEDGLMGEFPFWGPFWASPALDTAQAGRLRVLRDRVRAVLQALGKGPEQYGLIHADLHPGNVLVHDAGLHVIDFDDAGFGWHVYELAVTLHSYERHCGYPMIRDALVAGYRLVRPLPAEQVRLIPLFLLVRSLQLIGWITDRPELGRDHEIEGLVARAEALAARCL